MGRRLAPLRPEGMLTRLLGELGDACTRLSITFERSWGPTVVPDDWKKGHVAPIFKMGKKKNKT